MAVGHPHVRGDYEPRAAQDSKAAGHPHVRGDYTKAAISAISFFGPSPRAWGLQFALAEKLRASRAIPTCVGTTVCRQVVPALVPGHPHVRGDYT